MVVLHWTQIIDLDVLLGTPSNQVRMDQTDARVLYFPAAQRCSLVAHTATVDIRFTGSDSARGITVESFLSGQASDDDLFVLEGHSADSTAVRLTALPTEEWRSSSPGGGRLLVTIPTEATISISSGRGSILIEDVRGAKNVNVAEGDVAIAGGGGRCRVRCPNGNISIERYEGDGIFEGRNGRVDLSLVAGATRVVTQRAITVRGHIGSIDVTSPRGPVDVELMRIDSASRIATTSGPITLRLPPSMAARLTARASQGRLDAGEFLADSSASNTGSVALVLGGGGPDLTVESARGFVHLTR